MEIAIPEQLRKRITDRARRSGVTEKKYVQEALRYIVSGEETLEKEMRLWRTKARSSSLSFWKQHGL